MSKKLPPIPAVLPFPCGSIPVIKQEGLFDAQKDFGVWDTFLRTVTIDAKMSPVPSWLTLEHEKVHAILSDAGIVIDSDALEEAICNAIAAHRVYEMQR